MWEEDIRPPALKVKERRGIWDQKKGSFEIRVKSETRDAWGSSVLQHFSRSLPTVASDCRAVRCTALCGGGGGFC